MAFDVTQKEGEQVMPQFAAPSETVNGFRKARGKLLANRIKTLAARLGRPITVLDVGGRAEYWANVGTANIKKIIILNNEQDELKRGHAAGLFVVELGDACDLKNYPDQSVDLIHSNSVIEHVGDWDRMIAFADEAIRVGVSGWIQTPAWEFPIEPHFKMPFIHWLAAPLRRKMLRLSPHYGSADIDARRYHVDRINLLSRSEMYTLFDGMDIFTERFIGLPKSYVAQWPS